MSFAEQLLDGYDALEKKTANTLSGLKGLGSFMKHMGEVCKKCSTEAQSSCSKYKAKRVSNLEGTVKAAVIAAITEVETTVVAPFAALATEFERAAKDVAGFMKEKEQQRKKLMSGAAHMQKDWDATLAALRKARDAYHKAAKDAYAAQNAADKAPEKSAAAARQKAEAAADKARAADQAYGDLLVHTNDAQREYYTRTQPDMLARYQQWEEERIAFVRSQLSTLSDHVGALGLPDKWAHLTSTIHECAADIDAAADVDSYARSIASGVAAPADMPYEAAPLGPSSGGPAALSTGGTVAHRAAPAAPAAAQPSAQPSAPPQTQQHSDSSAEQDAAAAAAPAAEEEEEEGEKFKALYDYDTKNEGEMSLKEGEIVTITDKDPSGWWYATADDGREGFVPSSYVEHV